MTSTVLLTNASAGEESAEYIFPTNAVFFSWGGFFDIDSKIEAVRFFIMEQGLWEKIDVSWASRPSQCQLTLGTGAVIKAVVTDHGGSPSINLSATPGR